MLDLIIKNGKIIDGTGAEPFFADIGIENGNDSLVLGAFGCGAYKLPPEEVAPLFHKVMEEPEFKNKFKCIVFAILEKPRKPHGLDGKYAPFYREFGTCELNQ